MSEEQLLVRFRQAIDGSTLDFDQELSDALLLCFLRARKNDVDRAVQLLRNYREMARNHDDLMSRLCVEQLRPCLDEKMVSVSKSRDQNGRRLLFFRAGRWRPDHCSLDDIFRSNLFCLQLLASEAETQLSGLVAVVDMSDFAFYQARHFTPGYAKRVADLIRDVFPIRFEAIHLVNQPWIFGAVLAVIWPFLSAKIQKRIFSHGHCYSSLHEYIDVEHLPEDYGGAQDALDRTTWLDFMTANKNIFDCLN